MMGHRTHEGEPVSFKGREYLRAIYIDESPRMVIRKSTQCGITEYLLCRAFTKALKGRAQFYVLPTLALVGRVVRNRVDQSIEYSPIWRAVAAPATAEIQRRYGRQAQSVTLKHMGRAAIAFVGSNSRASFTEFPADDLIIDEMDECDRENIKMAPERLGDQAHPTEIRVGQPTPPEVGIDEEFSRSDQCLWHVRCDCGEWQPLSWEANVVEEFQKRRYRVRDPEWQRGKKVRAVCRRCAKPLQNKGPGEWVAMHPGRDVRGYHLSKLFAGQTTLDRLLENFAGGLRDDQSATRFQNGDMGMAYVGPGNQIGRADLDACVDPTYLMPGGLKEGVSAMGVDVGKVLHVRINVVDGERLRAVFIGTVPDFADLKALALRYRVKAGVIDAMPETRESRKVAEQLPGWWVCYYSQTSKADSEADRIITVNRTAALDGVKAAIDAHQVTLPANAGSIPGYYEQMMVPARVFNEAQQRFEWADRGKADHYFHAECYALLAAARIQFRWVPL